VDRLAKKHAIPVISDEIQAGMGNYFLDQLRSLQRKYPFIHDVTGIGLMDAMEMDSRKRRDRLIRKAFEKGLLLLSCG
jgi:4-aminobutyrate aminotransferase